MCLSLNDSQLRSVPAFEWYSHPQQTTILMDWVIQINRAVIYINRAQYQYLSDSSPCLCILEYLNDLSILTHNSYGQIRSVSVLEQISKDQHHAWMTIHKREQYRSFEWSSLPIESGLSIIMTNLICSQHWKETIMAVCNCGSTTKWRNLRLLRSTWVDENDQSHEHDIAGVFYRLHTHELMIRR